MTKVLAPTPLREYEIPGGPLAKNLPSEDVARLSDFERGGDEDLSRSGR